jgi:hypothetical protein
LERDKEVPELHDDALKRATTQHAAVVETKTTKGFHLELSCEDVTITASHKGYTTLKHRRW